MARAEQSVNRDLRDRVYDHLVELDLAFFGRVRMGQIVSRLTTEVETLRTLVTSELSKMLSAVLRVRHRAGRACWRSRGSSPWRRSS